MNKQKFSRSGRVNSFITQFGTMMLTFFSSGLSIAQDAQFSQFYSAPLYLNPAFVGSTHWTRVGANFRTQWPAIDANYVTLSAYADHYLDDQNSGIGIIITGDREGLAGLRSNSIGLQYSYQLPITQIFTVRAGVHAAYVLRDINFGKLTFGDQYDQNGFISVPTAETFDTGARKSFLDLGFGALLYSENVWLGVSAFHVNQPDQSLIGERSRLPVKYSVHLGYKFFLTPGVMGEGIYATAQERSLAPTIQYRRQGIFSQLDVGLYFTYEPVLFGIWYRGVPYKQFDGYTNNEALVFMVGFEKKAPKDALYIGYSYDFTISQLGASAGGAHEIAISYAFFTGDPRKPPKNVRLIPCRR